MMDVVVGGESKRVLRWDRAVLPARYQGSGVGVGNILIVFGAALGVAPLFFADGIGFGAVLAAGMLLWPLAGFTILLGAWVLSVSLVLREIRLQSYEAAIRAGDLVDVTAPREGGAGV